MAWKYREVQILDDASIGDSGTETVNINVRDPITALLIRFKATNDSTLDDTPPQANITRIEIIDGGQVYFSLSGPQAVAASAYGLGHYPSCWYDGRDSNTQRANFPLLFGRYLGDEQFAFDPRKLLNPQLRVTWADVAGYENGTLTLGVTARIMEGLPSPAKALMWNQIEAWNTADTGQHIVDLPVNLPIRALMHRVYIVTEFWAGIHTRFALDCDLGKFIPFDLAVSEYRDVTKLISGPFHVGQHGTWDFGVQYQGWLGEIVSVNLIDIANAAITQGYSAGAWHWFVAYFRTNAGAELTNRLAEVMCVGYYPENCVLYPFGRPDDPATWFPATDYKTMQFKITEAIADGAASVCVQQPRPIP